MDANDANAGMQLSEPSSTDSQPGTMARDLGSTSQAERVSEDTPGPVKDEPAEMTDSMHTPVEGTAGTTGTAVAERVARPSVLPMDGQVASKTGEEWFDPQPCQAGEEHAASLLPCSEPCTNNQAPAGPATVVDYPSAVPSAVDSLHLEQREAAAQPSMQKAGVEGLAVAPAPKRKIPGKKKVAAAPAVDTSKLQQADPDQPATAKQQEPPPVLEVDDSGSQDIQRMISEIHGPPGAESSTDSMQHPSGANASSDNIADFHGDSPPAGLSQSGQARSESLEEASSHVWQADDEYTSGHEGSGASVSGTGAVAMEGMGSYGHRADADTSGACTLEQQPHNIAEQLAWLHEESVRLQQQSVALQQRAMQMSLQVASNSAVGSASSNARQALGGPTPEGLTHDMLAGLSQVQLPDAAGAVDALGNPLEGLPSHLPGESTPTSVASSMSRIGLNWALPSRDGISSPMKMGDSRSSSFGLGSTAADGRYLSTPPSTLLNEPGSFLSLAANMQQRQQQPPPPLPQHQQQQHQQQAMPVKTHKAAHSSVVKPAEQPEFWTGAPIKRQPSMARGALQQPSYGHGEDHSNSNGQDMGYHKRALNVRKAPLPAKKGSNGAAHIMKKHSKGTVPPVSASPSCATNSTHTGSTNRGHGTSQGSAGAIPYYAGMATYTGFPVPMAAKAEVPAARLSHMSTSHPMVPPMLNFGAWLPGMLQAPSGHHKGTGNGAAAPRGAAPIMPLMSPFMPMMPPFGAFVPTAAPSGKSKTAGAASVPSAVMPMPFSPFGLLPLFAPTDTTAKSKAIQQRAAAVQQMQLKNFKHMEESVMAQLDKTAKAVARQRNGGWVT